MSKKIQVVGLDIPQSDWNQTDETQLDYIKNKPTDYVKQSYVDDLIAELRAEIEVLKAKLE